MKGLFNATCKNVFTNTTLRPGNRASYTSLHNTSVCAHVREHDQIICQQANQITEGKKNNNNT